MLIIGSGYDPEEKRFSCALSFNGPVGNVKEAVFLLVSRKRLFPEWIDEVLLVEEDRVLRHWHRLFGKWS